MKKYLLLLTTLIYSVVTTTKQPVINNQTLNIYTISTAMQDNEQIVTSVKDVVRTMQKRIFQEFYINIKDKIDKNKIICSIKITPNIVIKNNDDWTSIVCRSFSGIRNGKANRLGIGLLNSYGYLRNESLLTPAITFDWFDSLKNFNFGQQLDQKSLRYIHTNILKQNSDIKLILFGECMGATNALYYTTLFNENIHGLVLLAPSLTLKNVVHRVSHKYLKNFLGHKNTTDLIGGIFGLALPNYDKKQARILFDNVEKISNQKIIIHHIVDKDYIVSNSGIIQLINKLNKKNTVYLNIITDKNLDHSRIALAESIKFTNHAFYQSIGAPHNKEYAQKGLELLEHARYSGNNPVKAFLALSDQINDSYKFSYRI